MKLYEAISILTSAGVENPRHDAREIFLRIGRLKDYELISADASSELPELISAVKRRAMREPLQYIIGTVDFYRESYEVTPDCLIPRQETELLVDFAVKNIPCGKRFVDLCTGSGCIAISTLSNTHDTTALAVDLSEAALRVAEKNAKRNGVFERATFISKDVLTEPVTESVFAVLSNPPYVTEAAYAKLEPEIYKEPKMAFVAGEDGLIFYRRIIALYKSKIEPDGFFAFEIGYDQGEALCELARLHGMSAEIIKDYSGNDRIAILRLK